MRIFKKDENYVAVADKYIYLVEIYKAWTNGISFEGQTYVSCAKPLNIKNKILSTKTKKSTEWKRRFITLKFAPEKYLRLHGYNEI